MMLENVTLDINVEDEEFKCNAFWFACWYGRGEAINLLANSGINILNTNKITGNNALHVAIIKDHHHIAS